MSEQETITGKLKPTGMTLEQVMRDVEFPSYYDKDNHGDVKELFSDKFYREKILIKGMVYDVEEAANADAGDIYQANSTSSGDIEFVLSYYNGGCSFDEAIQTALKNIIQ